MAGKTVGALTNQIPIMGRRICVHALAPSDLSKGADDGNGSQDKAKGRALRAVRCTTTRCVLAGFGPHVNYNYDRITSATNEFACFAGG